MIKQFLNPPNWFTSASIFCGFYAILPASGADAGATQFYQAGLLIGFAGIFDMLDGRVARMTNSASEFGVQLDSLADVISYAAWVLWKLICSTEKARSAFRCRTCSTSR